MSTGAELKGGVVAQEGLATIGTAIETLKVAEHLTPILTEQLR